MPAMSRTKLRNSVTIIGVAALAACATPAPPPPPPPPPPQAVVIPPRPQPPSGASATMAIPQVGPDGVRQTVNARISPAQTVWNMRSALNVAALNCRKPRHAPLVGQYSAFLKKHARELRNTNSAVLKEARKRYGRSYHAAQDRYMTKVYNFFALPPAQAKFCDKALEVSNELALVERGELLGFAFVSLPKLESVFEDFFRSYEQYRLDLAAWDSRYGPDANRTGASSFAGMKPPGGATNLNAQYPGDTDAQPEITTQTPPPSDAASGNSAAANVPPENNQPGS